eukprot:GHVR01006745.1.p1 GENE.GHVR01006745.1~~GHVR01006745.1.p1  ORF type:complete len:167 (-),score=16.25 GHVR01006745.1:167-634(-)
MAGQSGKKTAKEAAVMGQRYMYAILGVNILYVLVMFILYWSTVTIWSIIPLIGYSSVTYFTYYGILDALSSGLPHEYYFDVLIINLSAQIASCMSKYGCLLYLSIPVFLCYKFGGYFISWALTREQEPPVLGEKERKRQEKMDKKMNQNKIIYRR